LKPENFLVSLLVSGRKPTADTNKGTQMALTDVAIRGFRPTEKIQKKSDSEVLQVWVLQVWVIPIGSKLWRYAWRRLHQGSGHLSWIPQG
jgi:hypothetical protein